MLTPQKARYRSNICERNVSDAIRGLYETHLPLVRVPNTMKSSFMRSLLFSERIRVSFAAYLYVGFSKLFFACPIGLLVDDLSHADDFALVVAYGHGHE